MLTRPLVFAAALLMAAALALQLRAQDQSQPAPPPTTPAAQPDTSAAAKPPAPKKVWTNDDFSAMPPANKTVATKPASAKLPAHPASAAKTAKWYHDQIQKLNAQIASIGQKMSAYQDALDGKQIPNNGLMEGHITRADWPAEIAKLQKQRADLLTKIGALQDQARHSGIDPNELP